MNAYRVVGGLSIPLALLMAGIPTASHAQAAGPTRFSAELLQPENVSDSTQLRGEHVFRVQAGQLVDVSVEADSFDTVLQIILPSGDTLVNDDYEGSRNSRISTIASASGEWRAIVSAFDLESGEYDVEVEIADVRASRVIEGELAETDSVSAKGHHFTRHLYRVERPVQLIVQMTSDDFEPELILHSPSGEVHMAVSDFSSTQSSTLTLGSAEPGEWEIITAHTSYSSELFGEYTLRIVEGAAARAETGEVVRGALTEDSPQQIHGEYYAEHRNISGSADAGMTIQLSSEAFDAYLAVQSPSGEWFRDDDSAGDGGALLELPAEAGEWRAIVTSYSPGETGDYQLRITR